MEVAIVLEVDDLDALLEIAAEQEKEQEQQRQSSNQAKIQNVQPYLRERTEFAQYYFPKVVSIGPIHHRLKDDKMKNLEQGEKYKRISMYLNDKGGKEKASQLFESIRSEIKTLKGLYTEDAIQGLNDDELAWILFIDGCAVIQLMNQVSQKQKLEALDIFVQHDLLLLENQLPYDVLKILNHGDDATLRKDMTSFLQLHHMFIPGQKRRDDQRKPTHLLDLLRTTILPDGDHEQKDHTGKCTNLCYPGSKWRICSKKRQEDSDKNSPTHRNVQELMLSGIKIKHNGTEKSLTSIDFRHHRIYLSELTADDFTVQTFLNMIAYEMCADFKSDYEISSYVSFLNSLIDNAEDVKELRKAGVLHNFLGSDEEVAKMFNTVYTDMVLDTGIYDPIRQKIERLYKHQWMIWFTQLHRKHFHSPWAIIGVIAAVLGFTFTVLSFIKDFAKHEL